MNNDTDIVGELEQAGFDVQDLASIGQLWDEVAQIRKDMGKPRYSFAGGGGGGSSTSGLTVGTTAITGGATNRVLYEDTGVLQENANFTWVAAANKLSYGPAGSAIQSGSGSPEGVVTSSVGELYQDTTNGQVYVKNTGVGNTGWALLDSTAPDEATIQTIAASGAITAWNSIVEATAAADITLTLPTVNVASTGKFIEVKKVDSGAGIVTVTLVSPFGSETVTLPQQLDAVRIGNDGTNTFVTADNRAASPFITVTAATTLSGNSQSVEATNAGASYAITLPAASTANAKNVVSITKTDSNTNSITVAGALVGFSLNSQGDAVLLRSNGTAWIPMGDVSAVNTTLHKFYVQQGLSAGANVINHNLALATPKAVVVQVRDDATGAEVSIPITAYTANSLTLTALSAVTLANITITA